MKRIGVIPCLSRDSFFVNPCRHLLAGRRRTIIHLIQQVAKTQQSDVHQVRDYRAEQCAGWKIGDLQAGQEKYRLRNTMSGNAGVTLHIMFQNALENGSMFGISGFPGMVDVVDDHALDALFTACRMDKIVSQFDGNHFRDVFMLGDGENFFFGQIGQLDTVLQRQHDDAPVC
jgi:hypothetical protein